MSRRRFAVGFTTLTAMLGVTGAGVMATQGVAFSDLPVVSALGLGDSKVKISHVTGSVKPDAARKLTGSLGTTTRTASAIRKGVGTKKRGSYKRLFTIQKGNPAIGCGFFFSGPPPAGTPVIINVNFSSIFTNPACLQYFLTAPVIFTP